jgi:predicted nucleotidyltransferase
MESCEQLQKDKHIDPTFICLIFGSYAKNEEKKGSDIDILFLTPGSLFNDKEIVRRILNKVNTLYQKKFHISHQHTRNFVSDLKKMKELSIATEIYKEPPIVFYGDDIFFRIIIGANKLW